MSQPVRIPVDVEREDRILGPLTARQALILAVTGIVLYGGYSVTRTVVPIAVLLTVAIPLAVIATLLVLGHRDGISMDRLVLAALRQRLSPQHRVTAPEGLQPTPDWLRSAPSPVSPTPLRLPAEAVTETGVIDLGKDGLALVGVCSTVNFGLRTPAEQESLVAGFGRYLHSLTAPVQVLVRAERLDLSEQINELREQAGGLPHPALEAAAREHADYLDQLRHATDLLRRQVLLILREPVRTATTTTGGHGTLSPLAKLSRRHTPTTGPVNHPARRAAEARLARRLSEAVELLSPAGIIVTTLDAGQTTAVLAAACDPDSLIPPGSAMAGADDVITTAPVQHWDKETFHRS